MPSPHSSSTSHDPTTQTLLQRYKATRIGPKRPLLLAMTIAFCLAFSLPDGATYYVYAEANARILYHSLGATHLAALVRFWCTWGGPIGVALFALNNMVRWSRLVNEARTLFPSYRNGRILWPVFIATTLLGLLSVVPFYGMAQHARLPMGLVLGNSFARFCMDQYAWQKITMLCIARIKRDGFASLFETPSLKGAFGGLIFITGMITATYLFPFAQEASNTTWALLGVAPTCLLWGLDARNSWTWLYSEGKKQFWPKPVPKPPFFDRDIRITKNILTACLVIMTLAGALSETMMAGHNAPIIGYPIRFLTVVAAIAFTGIYTTGPREILHQLAAFWQKRRKHSPRTHALREREEAALIQHIQIMRGLPEA